MRQQYHKLYLHYLARSYDKKLSARDQCYLVRKACCILDKVGYRL